MYTVFKRARLECSQLDEVFDLAAVVLSLLLVVAAAQLGRISPMDNRGMAVERMSLKCDPQQRLGRMNIAPRPAPTAMTGPKTQPLFDAARQIHSRRYRAIQI